MGSVTTLLQHRGDWTARLLFDYEQREKIYGLGLGRSSIIACQGSFHGGLICEHLCLFVQTGGFCLISQVPPLFLVAMTESWR